MNWGTSCPKITLTSLLFLKYFINSHSELNTYSWNPFLFLFQQSWDLVQQTQNYLKLLLSIINNDGESASACLKPVDVRGVPRS